jgi:hypothetical protein
MLDAKQHTNFLLVPRMDSPGSSADASGGGAAETTTGKQWLGAGREGRQEVLGRWRQREAALRGSVRQLWADHSTMFATYWREDLEGQPEVRAAMLLSALEDLLSHHAEEPAGHEETALGAVMGAACPELQDVPRLLASPDALLTLLAEPHSPHQEDQRQGVHEAAQELGQDAKEEAEAQGEMVLRCVRDCCLMQLGCNLLLLISALDQDDTSTEVQEEEH